MCAWIVWIRSLSLSNHPRSDHALIVNVIQSEHLKHSISPRNQSASLRSKRFQSTYSAKVRAEAKKKVEGGGGGGGEKRKRLPANPTILENAP